MSRVSGKLPPVAPGGKELNGGEEELALMVGGCPKGQDGAQARYPERGLNP